MSDQGDAASPVDPTVLDALDDESVEDPSALPEFGGGQRPLQGLVGVRTLFALLWQYSAGALASAIEQHGIHGVDRFGRPRYFAPGDSGASEALDALAEDYATMEWWRLHNDAVEDGIGVDPLEAGQPQPIQQLEYRFHLYGWPAGAVPDLGAPAPQPIPRAAAQTLREDTVLRLIAALAAELGIDIADAKAPQRLQRVLEGRGEKSPALNTLKGIVDRARNVAFMRGIDTARSRS